MKALFKFLLRKFESYISIGNIEKYKKNGILKIGKQCEIYEDTIFIVNDKHSNIQIEIGDNVCIRGKIILYTTSAKVKIGSNVYIGPNSLIECSNEIIIGNYVLISSNCNISDNDSHSIDFIERRCDSINWSMGLSKKDWNHVNSGKITIENDCWIGLRSIILKGVNLQTGSIVGAGSVVTKGTNEFDIVVGNPARVIRNLL